jgi:hypothetical protein
VTRRTVHPASTARCDKPSYQTCDHPQSSHRTGVVPPIDGDAWSLEPLDHVWIACARCGAILRSAPYADELEREAGLGLPRPTPVEA